VHVDFGTGDGTFVRRNAALQPDVLYVGVDAVAENLRDASRKSPENALFARLPLEASPGDLVAMADRLTVLFPWGSLLRAVAEPEAANLARLRALCKPAAEVRLVFEVTSDAAALERRYTEAGFSLQGRPMSVEEARQLPTTWAKKLGYSGRPRAFCEFAGRASAPGLL